MTTDEKQNWIAGAKRGDLLIVSGAPDGHSLNNGEVLVHDDDEGNANPWMVRSVDGRLHHNTMASVEEQYLFPIPANEYVNHVDKLSELQKQLLRDYSVQWYVECLAPTVKPAQTEPVEGQEEAAPKAELLSFFDGRPVLAINKETVTDDELDNAIAQINERINQSKEMIETLNRTREEVAERNRPELRLKLESELIDRFQFRIGNEMAVVAIRSGGDLADRGLWISKITEAEPELVVDNEGCYVLIWKKNKQQ